MPHSRRCFSNLVRHHRARRFIQLIELHGAFIVPIEGVWPNGVFKPFSPCLVMPQFSSLCMWSVHAEIVASEQPFIDVFSVFFPEAKFVFRALGVPPLVKSRLVYFVILMEFGLEDIPRVVLSPSYSAFTFVDQIEFPVFWEIYLHICTAMHILYCQMVRI